MSETGNDMVLNQVQTSQLDRKLCRFGLNVLGQPVNNDKIICAGVLDGSKDACHGDSGGPLVCLSNRKLGWEQQGIISVGIGCSNKRNPGLYTRVSSFINWIKSKAMVSTHRMSCIQFQFQFQLFYCSPKQLQLCSIITYQKNQATTGNLKGMLIPLTRAPYQ